MIRLKNVFLKNFKIPRLNLFILSLRFVFLLYIFFVIGVLLLKQFKNFFWFFLNKYHDTTNVIRIRKCLKIIFKMYLIIIQLFNFRFSSNVSKITYTKPFKYEWCYVLYKALLTAVCKEYNVHVINIFHLFVKDTFMKNKQN